LPTLEVAETRGSTKVGGRRERICQAPTLLYLRINVLAVRGGGKKKGGKRINADSEGLRRGGGESKGTRYSGPASFQGKKKGGPTSNPTD